MGCKRSWNGQGMEDIYLTPGINWISTSSYTSKPEFSITWCALNKMWQC